MTIINKTHWRADQLRAFVSRIAAEELTADRRKRLKITFVYTRKAGSCYSSGFAYYHGSATVRLSKHMPDKVDLAICIAHELAHTRGMRHPAMKGDPRYDRMPASLWRYAWAASMPLEVREARKNAIPGPDVKLEHAQKMLTINERKLKRATTIVRKWRIKVRYYERRKAAMNAPKEGKEPKS